MAFDWKKLVRTIAPAIGTALGGPLAGAATQAVSNAVLGKPDGTDDEIAGALAGGSSETFLKLKEADNSFKLEMKKLEIDLEGLSYQDAKDARAREIAVKDKMPATLAILLVLLFAGALGLLFWLPIPKDNQSTIYVMIGSLGTLTITACQYFHGSSRGSAAKNAALFQKTNQKK